MFERHATLIFFFSISISMNIVKIQDKPQREIRPTDIYAYKPQKEAYFHSKDFILDSV